MKKTAAVFLLVSFILISGCTKSDDTSGPSSPAADTLTPTLTITAASTKSITMTFTATVTPTSTLTCTPAATSTLTITSTPVIITAQFQYGSLPDAAYENYYERTLCEAQPDTVFDYLNDSTYAGYSVPADYYYNGIYKFDLSSIPAGSTVTETFISFYIRGFSNDGGTLRAYRITEDWDESQATWNRRKTGVSWSAPGGTFAEAVSDTFTAAVFSEITVNLEPQFIQNCINNPALNHGFMLKAAATTGNSRIYYKLHSTIDERMKLTVKYY